MSGPATEMFEVAAERLALPVEHLADLCDFYDADIFIGCDRLRFSTWDWNTDLVALVDWRPDGPPPPGTPGWPLRAEVIRVVGPSVPLGIISAWDQPENSKVLVAASFCDWVVCTYLFRSAAVVGGLGVVTVPDTIARLTAMGIEAERIVVAVPHLARRKHRKRARETLRSLRAAHPSVSVLRPEKKVWSIADGWREHGWAWKDALIAAIRDAQPCSDTTIPTPVGSPPDRPAVDAAGHFLIEQPQPQPDHRVS